MLTLYYKPTCPFSRRVLQEAERLHLDLNLKNIVEDEQAAAELITTGGKRQVPFLIDDDRRVTLYESLDIIKYFQDFYQPNTV